MNMKIFIGAVLYPAHGGWLNLPATDAEIEAAIRKAQTPDCEEVIIADSVGIRCSEYDNIYDVNEKAETISEFDEYQQKVVETLQEYYDLDEAVDIVADEDYMLWTDCTTMADVAYEYIEESGLLNGIPDELVDYFDYDAYGRDMEINGHFIYTSDGYIEVFNR